MAMLFKCGQLLKDLKICGPSAVADTFCFDSPEASALTTKILDLFYNKHYNFSISHGGRHGIGSGGLQTRRKNSAILWRLGTPRSITEEELASGEIKLGGSGPKYMLKCDKTHANSSCKFWKPGKEYPDPLATCRDAPSHSISSSWYQNPPGCIHWFPFQEGKVPDSTQFAEPDADSVYEIKHSPCLETIFKDNQIVKQSSDCKNLSLFHEFLEETTGSPGKSADQIPPTPPVTPSTNSNRGNSNSLPPSNLSYLQVGGSVASALFCGYKTYKEACKYFRNKKSSAETNRALPKDSQKKELPIDKFSSKRLLGYGSGAAFSLAYAAYALRV